MRHELLAVGVLVLAVTGSVAYACGGTGSTGCQGSGSRGSQCTSGLEWLGPSGATPSAPSVGCSVSLTPETLSVRATNLAPGETCAIYATLYNPGQAPESVSESVTISSPRSCTLFDYADDLPSSPLLTLNGGATFAFRATVGLAASAGDACEGALFSVTVVLTAGTVNTCEPYGDSYAPLAAPVGDWECGGGW